MHQFSVAARFVAFLVAGSIADFGQASFHLWKFSEFYSNADGSVQFIEMLDPSNFEDLVGGKTITSLSTGKTFTFANNLSTTSTANHRLLIATPGFSALPHGVTPDFTLPSANFFNPAGDTLNFAGGFDVRTFASVPTDGIMSRIYPSNTLATNSPTNFAGQTDTLNLATPTGDYNANGVVDAADYVVWRNTSGQSGVTPGTAADGNSSGAIDAGDYDYWRARFGKTAGSGSGLSPATGIPEPTSAIVLLLSTLSLIIARCRR